MKKIVLIGRFDDIAKDLTSVLSKHFSVQECISNPELIKGFLTVVKPDAAIVSLVGVNKEYGRILGVLKNSGPKLPVFVSEQKRNSPCSAVISEMISFLS